MTLRASLLISLLLSGALFAQNETFVRHTSARVGDTFFFGSDRLGMGTTNPNTLLDFLATDTTKTIPFMKITQNVGTPSYGIIIDANAMDSDPRESALRIMQVPSRNVLMTVTRDKLYFGDGTIDSSNQATVIVGANDDQSFSGNLLLRDNATSATKVGFGTTGKPVFGTLKGRGGSRGGTILRAANSDQNVEIRFTYEEDGGEDYLIIHVKQGSETERSVYFAVTENKTFVINHPDSDKHYLVHSGIEGPSADVLYTGTATLENGEATVRLPDYFEALTKTSGRTIRLTAIDGFATLSPVLLANGHTIHNGYFKVRSDDPTSTLNFDWEVKAIRSDVKPLTVEPLKKDVRVDYEGPYSWPSISGEMQ